jgi:soluble lytic murein transglycosylase-like protein
LAYLQWLLNYFKGDVSLVAAAYNAGEGAVKAHRGIPPYPETRDYVQKVLSLYRKPMQVGMPLETSRLAISNNQAR